MRAPSSSEWSHACLTLVLRGIGAIVFLDDLFDLVAADDLLFQKMLRCIVQSLLVFLKQGPRFLLRRLDKSSNLSVYAGSGIWAQLGAQARAHSEVIGAALRSITYRTHLLRHTEFGHHAQGNISGTLQIVRCPR